MAILNITQSQPRLSPNLSLSWPNNKKATPLGCGGIQSFIDTNDNTFIKTQTVFPNLLKCQIVDIIWGIYF
ncbi:hypothetical protein CGT97_14445 [Vibrio metoecus]|nr:hypothetical protein CGT97_14445 [Vibrio metoecus]